MDKSCIYNLIQAIDPTKIKIPISNRFSKLTLSSNKKKPTHAAVPKDFSESHKRVSRNLMEELSALAIQPENLLLCSATPEQENETNISIMDPLIVAEDSDNFNQAIDNVQSQELNNSLINKFISKTETKNNIKCSTEICEEEPICLSSASESTNVEEDFIISLSDSTGSNPKEPNEMLLSNQHMTLNQEIDDESVSNERNKRLQAFLRDVSYQYDNRVVEILDAKDSEVIVEAKSYNDLTKSCQLAIADTESMTPEDDSLAKMPSAILEREKRLLALDDNPPSSSPYVNEIREQPHKRFSEATKNQNETNIEDDEKISHLSHVEESINCSAADNTNNLPMESIVISETDDELFENDNDCKSETRKSQQEADKRLSSKFSENITDSESNGETQGAITSSDLDNIEIAMGNINLSAKIQVNIHIRSDSIQSSSTGESSFNSDSEKVDDCNDERSADEMPETPKHGQRTSTNSENSNKTNSTPRKKLNISTTIEATESEFDASVAFVSQAEKILSQLYGKSWQTPEVMRTLKQISPQSSKLELRLENTLTNRNNNTSATHNCTKNTQNSIKKKPLDDFSMFCRSIDSKLDSTRYTNKPNANNMNTKQTVHSAEFKKPLRNVERNKNQRWKLLVDNDSDNVINASDDSDADWTEDNISHNCESDGEGKRKTSAKGKSKKPPKAEEEDLIYLDLSKREVEVQKQIPKSPPANSDEHFITELQKLLQTCRREEPAKLPSGKSINKGKLRRKLFTPAFGDENVELELEQQREQLGEQIPTSNAKHINTNDVYLDDKGFTPFNSRGVFINKQLEAVKVGKPIFVITPPNSRNSPKLPKSTPKSVSSTNTPKTSKLKSLTVAKQANIAFKYNFLKSLDVCASKSFCHPEAVVYRENYRTKKEELAKTLYDLFNEKLFDSKLEVPLTWNKKLCNTAGRCLNRKRGGVRTCTIELSDKVLTSADRLRCTLIHEMCHAATWIFSGEGGHGATWRMWAQRANSVFPEIPKIRVCHQYDIEYKYTYKCSLCGAKSNAHSKSKKVESIRCSFCHGAIEIFLNKKDKEGNIMPTPVKEATGFAKFVKDNYKKFKREDLKHSEVMKALSAEYAAMKMAKIT